eukprot:5764156-Pyramimonas_sp.AAC.1
MRLGAAAFDVAFVSSVPLAPLIRVAFLSSLECRGVSGGRTEGHLKGVRKGKWTLGCSFAPYLARSHRAVAPGNYRSGPCWCVRDMCVWR